MQKYRALGFLGFLGIIGIAQEKLPRSEKHR